MIIVCQKCSSRLQVDTTKVPNGSFNIRCPKCNNSVEFAAPSPTSEQSAVAVGDSPATENPRFERPNAAPLFEAANDCEETKPDGRVRRGIPEKPWYARQKKIATA